MKVQDARVLSGLDAASTAGASLPGSALLAASVAAGFLIGTALLGVMLPLAPFGFVAGHLARRRAHKAQAAAAMA